MQKNRILITCAKGAGFYLQEELRALGFPVLAETVASATTEGTMEDAVRLNLLLCTGQRVLYLVKKFVARDAAELYGEVSKIAWEDYIAEDGYLCVTSTVDNPDIKDSRFANVKCKDAIVDRIRERLGQRPDSGPEQDRTVVNIYWKGDDCSLYFDTSGDPLSKRGYRKIPLKAPMQETLAAVVIKATGWDGSRNLINPMCGSGTLAIEAALAGLNRAPGILRNNYGFMHLKNYDKTFWDNLRANARKAAKKNLQGRIIATDIREEAVEAAKKNAATAGVEHLIEFKVCDFSQTDVPEGGGIVLLNPEYGERMGKIEELEATYKNIGDFFKQKCGGYSGYIFTGNLELVKKVGLRSKRKIQLFNGAIECRLLEYELYAGSRKTRQETEA
ncbi:MAG: class I SAM-dependent RNA methyltransferase [Nitrospirae bacterium]|nr:class I SAM-dependent RNA methyltransferase [Nitrospirota bacterium]